MLWQFGQGGKGYDAGGGGEVVDDCGVGDDCSGGRDDSGLIKMW